MRIFDVSGVTGVTGDFAVALIVVDVEDGAGFGFASVIGFVGSFGADGVLDATLTEDFAA